MNIGYSYWGFLADIKLNEKLEQLSTPDGNAFYSWSIIHELQKHGAIVTSVMPDRDKYAVSEMGMSAFSAWATLDRFSSYYFMRHITYNDIDWKTVSKDKIFELFDAQKFNTILHEWRMPIPNRNTLDCRENDDWQPDLFLQECIIDYCKSKHVKLVIFDLDYKLTDVDIERLGDSVTILELGTKWRKLKNAKQVYIPFDFSHIYEFGIKPVNERTTSLIYIGNRYERDWCIDKYVPNDLKRVVVHGNWLESNRDSASRWPNIDFRKRLQTNEMHEAYSNAVCTLLLAKKEYCDNRFMTARLIESIFYGTVPLFIEEYGYETIHEFAGIFAKSLTVSNEEDVKKKISELQRKPIAYVDIITYLRERLKDMMDASIFVEENIYGLF